MPNVVVVNENDEIIGVMPKSEAHKDGTLHRIAVVFVENGKNEILVQVRQDGYLDHSAAGHVDPGESYKQAAERELAEELGIKDVALDYVGHGSTLNEQYPGSVSSHVFDIFKCTADPKELQRDEVNDVYWATPEEVLKDMQRDPTKYCGGFLTSLPIYVDMNSRES